MFTKILQIFNGQELFKMNFPLIVVITFKYWLDSDLKTINEFRHIFQQKYGVMRGITALYFLRTTPI